MTSEMIYTLILRDETLDGGYGAAHLYLPQGLRQARIAAADKLSARYKPDEIVAVIPGSHPTDLMPAGSPSCLVS